ncbi:hypothetical protein NliqN6_0129 [Naganishia liquefaciens]|uniref:Cytochrome b5 heme-binding domain-containing protein n=1 Tax=Naganishia liquefaciens TaxID=104408 RepID=A0A8H3YCY1_9TREE|nr:hypothetical protein NliqN6_0129 [Naganishia liquefaciens]
MVPPEYHLPFFDTPLGFTLVILAIVTGFYLFIGRFKTPADYHRQGVAIQEQSEKQKEMSQQASSQQAVENGKKGEKIEQAASIMAPPAAALAPPKDDPITPAQLAQHDGTDESKPIYVAIKGTVFDVTAKRAMYGPGAGYNVFAGKDGSVGLGKSSLKPEDAVPDYSTLEPAEMKVLDQWYDFFSKRYNVVGKVVQ